MKIRTNYSLEELELIGKGLTQMVKSQRNKPIVPDNVAEKEVFKVVDDSFDEMMSGIVDSIKEGV